MMPRTPTLLTLSQAAKATGKSKSVISKALKTGVISFVEKDDSGYKIDPAELFRVFPAPDLAANQNTPEERSGTLMSTGENSKNAYDVNGLRVENHLLQERLKDKEERIGELKEERDRWHQTASRLMLTYQPAHEASGADTQHKNAEGKGTSLHWMVGLLVLMLLAGGLGYYFQHGIGRFMAGEFKSSQPIEPLQKPEIRFSLPSSVPEYTQP